MTPRAARFRQRLSALADLGPFPAAVAVLIVLLLVLGWRYL